MPFNYNDCVREGLLRRIPPSKDKAAQSLKKAREWLKEAENSLRGNALNSSILASYMVMFHAARTILFLDGFREKSHACVARYLDEKYVKTGKLDKENGKNLNWLFELRSIGDYGDTRHVPQEDAARAIAVAQSFVAAIKKLLPGLE